MTEIDREELVAKLEIVAPALASRSPIPQLNHFWFTGTTVMAYNSLISISVPNKTDFRGAVPSTLLSLLKSLQRKTVDLIDDDGPLLIKSGKRSAVRLGMLPPDYFLFTMPKDDAGVVVDHLMMEAVEDCMRSIGSSTSSPEHLGVTVVPNGEAANIYTTNNKTISSAKLNDGSAFGKRVILPTAFCKQMISLYKRDDDAEMRMNVANDHVILRVGDVTLFGRLIESERPLNFATVIEQHFQAKDHSKLIPIPKGLKRALERAIIITNTKLEDPVTKVTVIDGYAKLFSSSSSSYGEASDKLKLDAPHDDIKISINPKLLASAIDDFDSMVITDRCVVMTNTDGSQYLVAASTTK